MSGTVDIQKVCADVTGYGNYVPCRLCTAWVPRFDLEAGLLPEETRHGVDGLKVFFLAERDRRLKLREEYTK